MSSYAVLIGDGSGQDDIIEMHFEETGNEIGYTPSLRGRMDITAKINNHRITHLNVHGYHAVDDSSL